jgi:DNA-binding response OmpR family regulator
MAARHVAREVEVSLILIVDDDAAVRASLQYLLEADGHEVLPAGNSADARVLYDTRRPHIVITDLVMPGKAGTELIAELRAAAPALRIIAMSGGGRTGTDDVLQVARARGADAVVEKPFEADMLLDLVQRMVRVPGERSA